ncbi:MAG: phenylacetate--CoA ligase family protein [Bacillota bacterium]
MGIINILLKKFFYDRHLKYSKEDIKVLQDKKFKKLLKYTYKKSSFYKKLYKKSGIDYKELDNIELENLPVVNKKMIMDNFNDVLTINNIKKNDIVKFIEKNPDPKKMYKDKYIVVHSSGTTGEIGYYIYTKKNWELLKAVGSSRLFNSFSLKSKKYAFIGAVDGHYAGISFFLSPVNKIEQLFYKDYLIIDINYPLESYIDKLNEFQPDIISGYPSALELLIDYQKDRKLDINPEHIICGGEPLSTTVINKIKKHWNKTPYNFYGTSESILMGVGIGSEGIYIFDDLVIVEIKDEKILLTNLYNYSQPLIRYEINDLMTKSDIKNIGWPFKHVENISGRTEDLLWLINNKNEYDFIHPIVIVELHLKGVKRYQLTKLSDRKIMIKVVKQKNADKSKIENNIKDKLEKIIQKKDMTNVMLDIKFVNEIKNNPVTGKFNIIKNSCNS